MFRTTVENRVDHRYVFNSPNASSGGEIRCNTTKHARSCYCFRGRRENIAGITLVYVGLNSLLGPVNRA